MSKKSESKDSSNIGLTEQLELLEEMEVKRVNTELKRLEEKEAKRLSKRIAQASIALIERNTTTGFELVLITEVSKAYCTFDSKSSLSIGVSVPNKRVAALKYYERIDDRLLYLVPEMQAIALPVGSARDVYNEDVYVLIGPNDIAEQLIIEEQEEHPNELPEGLAIGRIIDWLESLIEEPPTSPSQ